MPKINHQLNWRFLFLKKSQKTAYFYPFILPKLNGGLIAALFIVNFANAASIAGSNTAGLCALIAQLQGVFKTLRILAFIGAGFILAKYGWEAISSGKLAGSDNVVDGLKKIGIPMIIGFTLLFSIGILLGYLSNGDNFGCPTLTTGW